MNDFHMDIAVMGVTLAMLLVVNIASANDMWSETPDLEAIEVAKQKDRNRDKQLVAKEK